MQPLKKKFREIKKLPDWLFWFPSLLMSFCFHVFHRMEVRDPLNLIPTARGYIAMAWHNRLLYFAPAFPKETRKRCVAVISASRDGQYVADFVKRFGIGSVRGSSSKKGANALLGAVHAIEEGKLVIFTPDGPRGPRYTIKAGPVLLASKTGAPIVPLGLNYSRCWALKSWDGFQIPKPGAKLTLIIGEPIVVPPDLTADELELWRQKVENAMRAVNVDPPGLAKAEKHSKQA